MKSRYVHPRTIRRLAEKSLRQEAQRKRDTMASDASGGAMSEPRERELATWLAKRLGMQGTEAEVAAILPVLRAEAEHLIEATPAAEAARLRRRVETLTEVLKRVEGFGARLPSNLLEDVRAALSSENA